MDQPLEQFFAEVAADPYRYDLMQVLRRLHALDPSLHLGRSLRPRDDRLRLQQQPDLKFAGSALRRLEPPTPAGRPARLVINSLGLLGPNGPLPQHVTEYAMERLRAQDATLAGFFDLFHHRLLSLFFRAWKVHQKSVDLDRAGEQQFTRYLGSFIGRGTPALQGRDEVSDAAKLYFSGRLASPTRHAEGLGAILSEYFGVRAEVEPFVGQWLTLPETDACQLGASPSTGLLGTTVIVGSRVWQCQTKFRLRLGPMRLADLRRLLPRTGAFARLKAWVKNYTGDELFWDAQYVLLKEEVPQTQLGNGGLLGWTTWITTRTPDRDAEDLFIDPALN